MYSLNRSIFVLKFCYLPSICTLASPWMCHWFASSSHPTSAACIILPWARHRHVESNHHTCHAMLSDLPNQSPVIKSSCRPAVEELRTAVIYAKAERRRNIYVSVLLLFVKCIFLQNTAVKVHHLPNLEVVESSRRRYNAFTRVALSTSSLPTCDFSSHAFH